MLGAAPAAPCVCMASRCAIAVVSSVVSSTFITTRCLSKRRVNEVPWFARVGELAARLSSDEATTTSTELGILACQLLSAAGGRTRGRQSRADIAQASGHGREFTRKQKPLGRDGHLGCAWSWLLWRALSLKTKSMTPCLWAVAPAVAWVCSSGGGGTMASHAAGGDAKAGSVPGQGQAHLKIATGVATGGVEWAFE